MLNLLAVLPGQLLKLKSGVTVQVTENVGDGIWLNAKFPEGDEELVFCEDIEGLADETPAGA